MHRHRRGAGPYHHRVTLTPRVRRWLHFLVSFERNVASVRDANGIAICFCPVPGQPCITCPRCLMTSYSPEDIQEGYCGNCRDWTSRSPGPAQG
jgi:hypothetical protein